MLLVIYGLYLSTAGAKAQSFRQDVIANNVANVDTGGFRRQFAVVQARPDHGTEFGAPAPVRPDDPRRLGGGVHMYRTPSDTATMGPIKTTGSPLDVAIDGEGFFRVLRDGQVLLTRSGAFRLGRQGVLQTADGLAEVLSADGRPIRLDGNSPIAISPDGGIFQNDAAQGRLDVRKPAGPGELSRVGENLYRYDGPLAAAGSPIRQGMLEGSNVEPIREMVDLIATARSFEFNVNLIQLQNDGLANLIQQVPRLT